MPAAIKLIYHNFPRILLFATSRDGIRCVFSVATVFFIQILTRTRVGNRNKLRLVTLTANIYLIKVNNRSSRKRCEICSKLTIKTPGRRHHTYLNILQFSSGVFIVNFEHISHLFLVSLLLTLNK